MRTVRLSIKDSIYHNVIFLLESLKEKGVEIEEIKPTSVAMSKKESLKHFLNSSDVKPFEDIGDPIEWQHSIRNE
ncbi:MAG: hypothetical protein WCR69_09425 [Sulfuricurvum sp.]|jgi:hypothetical protein